MNPNELNDKLLSLLLPFMVGTAVTTIVSWKVLEAITKRIELGENWKAFLTALTVGGIVLVFAAVGAGLWVGYRYIRPDAPQQSEPSKAPDAQAQTVAPTQEPSKPTREQHAFKPHVRPGRRQAPPRADETAQAADAPLTPQTRQSPAAAAPPAQSQQPQAPATETRPIMTPVQGPGCTNKPTPATIIIPPGEKAPEQDRFV